MCDAVAPVAVAPSPNVHAYVSVSPASGSDEVVASNATAWFTAGDAGANVKRAVGTWFGGGAAVTVTVCVVLFAPPLLSSTVSVTVNGPAAV